MTEETFGFLRHQARASWDCVMERESAIGCPVASIWQQAAQVKRYGKCTLEMLERVWL